MKWLFPAKTFLVGEYVALQGGPALILTTTPCFEVGLEKGTPTCNFPVGSPAHNFWQKNLSFDNYIINWHDPYFGLGGMGASSAQFLGIYYARNFIKKYSFQYEDLLSEYLQHAWNGKGIAPSGYDVIAQAMGGSVYIEGLTKIYKNYSWPFPDISFILLHTGKKQATHTHLQNLDKIHRLDKLTNLSQTVCDNFLKIDSTSFINAINDYYLTLCELNLVAQHTQEMISFLKNDNDILAIKGCGALGSDILLLVVATKKLEDKLMALKNSNYNIIATIDNFSSI